MRQQHVVGEFRIYMPICLENAMAEETYSQCLVIFLILCLDFLFFKSNTKIQVTIEI